MIPGTRTFKEFAPGLSQSGNFAGTDQIGDLFKHIS